MFRATINVFFGTYRDSYHKICTSHYEACMWINNEQRKYRGEVTTYILPVDAETLEVKKGWEIFQKYGGFGQLCRGFFGRK